MTKSIKKSDPIKLMLLPIVLFVFAVIFWQSKFLLPIKYLTVFFHELSHGLAAILTGGKIIGIRVTSDQGGLCTSAGGWRSIILSAGYLGSLFWGSLILLLASKTNKDKEIVGVFGIMLILVTVLWVRNAFGIFMCLTSGIALLIFAKYATEFVCDQFLKFFGLTSCFYVITDIKSDLIDRSIPNSDAYRLAVMFHLPDWLVGGAWFLFAIFVTYKVLKSCLKS